MNKPQLLAGFAVKILMGLIYGYIFLHYYNGDDTWKFFRASLAETELLINDTKQFFINEFTPENALRTGKNLGEVVEVYLNDLQYVLVVKTMAVFNLVSRGNYYVNVIFFNAIVFFGHYWLYKLLVGLFPAKKQLYYLLIFFFLPSVFWLSGIRVDGMVFFFLSLLLYYACGRHDNKLSRWLVMVIAFGGVVICRPQLAILSAIALAGYAIGRRNGRPAASMTGACLFALLLFFMPASGLTAFVAGRQHQFLQLTGTKFELGALDASAFSYLKVLPQAVANTFLRPFPWEAKGFLQLLASAEVALFWVIILIALYRRHPFWKVRLQQPVILTLLVLGVMAYIMIGYIVPFPGAIVRYKAIPEMLILCAVVSLSNYGESNNYKKL
jgi:hypothetical protein